MVAALLIAALLQTAPAARLGNVEGSAEIVRANGASVARPGDTVSAGERLQTSKTSALTVSTESGVVLQLGAESKLELKNTGGEPIALLTEGSVNVKSSGKAARIETKYGQIIGVEESHEFDVRYSGDVIHVLVIRGAVRAEVFDASKVFFKNAADLATRTYVAGSITPNAPRVSNAPIVIVYPRVEDPNGRKPRPAEPPIRQLPPK
jgi:ferric-dicitrate binding protein FerR (iron transport regulator)